MILGRNAGLWAALVAAAINVAVLVLGVQLTTDQVVALNVLALALIGLIANEADPTTAGTFARTLSAPVPSAATGTSGSSGATASPPSAADVVDATASGDGTGGSGS